MLKRKGMNSTVELCPYCNTMKKPEHQAKCPERDAFFERRSEELSKRINENIDVFKRLADK